MHQLNNYQLATGRWMRYVWVFHNLTSSEFPKHVPGTLSCFNPHSEPLLGSISAQILRHKLGWARGTGTRKNVKEEHDMHGESALSTSQSLSQTKTRLIGCERSSSLSELELLMSRTSHGLSETSSPPVASNFINGLKWMWHQRLMDKRNFTLLTDAYNCFWSSCT